MFVASQFENSGIATRRDMPKCYVVLLLFSQFLLLLFFHLSASHSTLVIPSSSQSQFHCFSYHLPTVLIIICLCLPIVCSSSKVQPKGYCTTKQAQMFVVTTFPFPSFDFFSFQLITKYLLRKHMAKWRNHCMFEVQISSVLFIFLFYLYKILWQGR